MNPSQLSSLTSPELLALYTNVAKELRARKITRSANSPTGDLAEYVFCRAFQWEPTRNSFAGIDAKGPDGAKYQIKGRRGKSRQMGAIRDIDQGHFDFLAGVLFEEDYSVSLAA